MLADFGVILPVSTEIRIWDSTAEVRYLVVPRRPPGTDDLTEGDRRLVTRDSMIGTGLPRTPNDPPWLSIHADLGGQDGHGRVVPERESELFHAPWEPQALALTLAMGATDAWNIDMSHSARQTLAGYGTLTSTKSGSRVW